MLCERIRELREAAHFTQVELAKMLCVTKQSVSNWENNNIQPSIEMLIAIADFFGTTTDYLLGRDDQKVINVSGLSDADIQNLNAIVKSLRRA